ncbi:hypothetical protein NliqN6_0662 [Naganishia liquefaciens]|uniref:Uncharacterized protein n=1 Tax=Naganishia liquefaciens TaxID=104408 RepID=A0A8H3TND2_9TREE|nr:hypothetical protein NliqN6_0662 [Naganishia liquefaciens]
MPVLKKKGALFAVYHDSPDKTAQPPPSTTTTSHKKHVLAARSPTTRSKTKAGLTSVKPCAAVVAASAALQAHSGNTLGPAALARKAGGGREAADKENLRSLGMGKVRAKMQVFQDDDEALVKPVETKPRVRRALGSKLRTDVQPTSRTIPRDINAPHVPSTPAFTVFHDFPTREQENIPPPGADPERNPSPAVRRSTRKMAAVARDDSGSHEPESPYVGKPRLRKLQKVTQPVVVSPRRTVDDDVAASLASPLNATHTPIVLASSQPHPDAHQPTLDSSPLFTRPQTRKQPSSFHPSTKSLAAHPPTYSVPADPILCDVSEAYGADPRAQPDGFTSRGTTSGVARKVGVRIDRSREEGKPRLRPSIYGWTQISLGEYQAPKPPPPSRQTRQSRSKW